jgi:hypothetical protein
MAMLGQTDDWCVGAAERRKHRRLTMAGRAARLDAPIDCGLCSVVNLSNGGILVETPIQLNCGEPVRISFDCTNSVQGRVVWRTGRRAGIRFLMPFESAELIAKLAKDRWAGSARAPRLTVNRPARVVCGSVLFHGVVGNISQQGLSLQHTGELTRRAAVELAMNGIGRIRGTVQWADESLAGIKIDGMLTIQELSSKRRLALIEFEPTDPRASTLGAPDTA